MVLWDGFDIDFHFYSHNNYPRNCEYSEMQADLFTINLKVLFDRNRNSDGLVWIIEGYHANRQENNDNHDQPTTTSAAAGATTGAAAAAVSAGGWREGAGCNQGGCTR